MTKNDLIRLIESGLNAPENDKLFHQIIVESLAFLKKTDSELARKIRISQPAITRWKTGKSAPHVSLRVGVFKLLKNDAEVTQKKSELIQADLGPDASKTYKDNLFED